MEKPELVFSPTDFVAITNQTLEYAFGIAHIQGELANFRISKNKWVYFDLKDDTAKVSCFASIYALPGPLEDGMVLKISGSPRLHPQFGFSVTVQTIVPAGEGSIKKAFELLRAKLVTEGLFDVERKRILPRIPRSIALIASVESAAYADFMKILTARWPFAKVVVYDTQVQGEAAPEQLVQAINMANAESELADVMVVTRGGGSADDLSAFNDERVVRALAASRIPTLVAIGHEIDESLSELAADRRASTPSNAAEMIAPDKVSEQALVAQAKVRVGLNLNSIIALKIQDIAARKTEIVARLHALLGNDTEWLIAKKELLAAYNPQNVLKRGYAVVTRGQQTLVGVNSIKTGDAITVVMRDGEVDAQVKAIRAKLK